MFMQQNIGGIFVRDEVFRDIWIRLEKKCYEELHNLYYLHNTKHRGGDGLQRVARTGHMRNVL